MSDTTKVMQVYVDVWKQPVNAAKVVCTAEEGRILTCADVPRGEIWEPVDGNDWYVHPETWEEIKTDISEGATP